MNSADDLRKFIASELVSGDEVKTLAADDDLLAQGLLDSVGIAELISYVADRFGVEITDDELTPENFRTIEAIAELVEAKTEARAH